MESNETNNPKSNKISKTFLFINVSTGSKSILLS